MGLFSRKKQVDPPAAGDDIDPVNLAAAIIASAGPQVPVTLAMVIYRLLEAGVVDAEGLTKLGLSRDELGELIDALSESNSAEELNAALELRTALAQYNTDLANIAGERGVSTKSDEYIALRSAIAGFAEKNDILDVKIAYRLMLAECPDSLPGSTVKR